MTAISNPGLLNTRSVAKSQVKFFSIALVVVFGALSGYFYLLLNEKDGFLFTLTSTAGLPFIAMGVLTGAALWSRAEFNRALDYRTSVSAWLQSNYSISVTPIQVATLINKQSTVVELNGERIEIILQRNIHDELLVRRVVSV